MKIALLLAAAPAGRVFGLDQATLNDILIQLFNACVLAAALSFILYKPVRNFLHKRAEKIKSLLSQADEDTAEAERLKAEYEKKLEDIEQERLKALETAYKLADERGAEIIERAEAEARDIKERAAADALREQKRVQEEVRMQIVDVASIMAEKFLATAMDDETRDRLFAQTLAELEDTTWAR